MPEKKKTALADDAIQNLRLRARRAKHKLYWIVAILLASFSGLVTYEYMVAKVAGAQWDAALNSSLLAEQRATDLFSASRTIKGDLQNKFSVLIDGQIGHLEEVKDKPQLAAKPQYEELDQKIDKTLEQYSKAQEILAKSAKPPTSTDWESLVETGIINLGFVAVGLFLIQIALNFLRYYAQLAELYDAQADALVAAAGDQEQAAIFLKQFSPTIDFGKTPMTVYEKAFDTVKEAMAAVAKKAD